MTTNLKKIEQIANEMNNDMEKVRLELRRLQSVKSRLKKQKGKSTYEKDMTKVLQDEEVMKQVRALLDPKEKNVPDYTQEDVNMLDYDETVKAIKSIQSKKTLTKWLTEEEGNNDEFRRACEIENMLQEHRKNIRPIEETVVRKTDVQTILDTLESNNDLSQERIAELLKKLM